MAQLVLPNGRGHGWKPQTRDINDDRYAFAKLFRKVPIPDRIYLKPEALPDVRDQGQQGCCTGFGLTGALMWSYAAKRGVTCQLSPAFAYLEGRIAEGSVNEDSGCEIRDVVKKANEVGVCLEKLMPYSDKKLYRKATKRAQRNAAAHQVALGYHLCDVPTQSGADAVDNMLQALAQDLPVDGGYAWYSCLDTADFEHTGVMVMPQPKDKLEGGHCNWVCGADVPSRMFLLQNSYGPDFGAKHPVTGKGGYVLMPFAHVEQRIASDFWAISHE